MTMPAKCYAVTPATGELVRIDLNQQGYMSYVHAVTGKPIVGKEAIQKVNALNKLLGVTWQQREAMLIGSMFGWHVPAANPEHPMYLKKTKDPLAAKLERVEGTEAGLLEGFRSFRDFNPN